MPKDSVSIFNNDEPGGHVTPSSDVWFENERAMWWAEFDGVGEEAVRNSVERHSYPPTGMEVARQWLVRRELFHLSVDVQSIRALAAQAQEAAYKSLRIASEVFLLVSQAEADSRASVDTAAAAKTRPGTMALVGIVACLFGLSAMAMVLASSRQGNANTKQQHAQLIPAKHGVMRPLPQGVLPGKTRLVAEIQPENAKKAPSSAPQIISHDMKPERRSVVETRQASAMPLKGVQRGQPSNSPQVIPRDLKQEGQPLAQLLALIADQLVGEGTIDFTTQFQDTATGRYDVEQLSYKASDVTIDPNRCQIGYQWHVEKDGKVLYDEVRTVELHLAKRLWVTSIDDETGGRYLARTYPKVYVVHIARWDNSSGDNLYFHDKDVAARVGSATRQALELCDNRGQQLQGP